MHRKIIGILVVMLLITIVIPTTGIMNIKMDDLSNSKEATISDPDLCCLGTIGRDHVKPGQMIKDRFYILNIGEPCSLLDWEISEWPDWGTDWTFNPSSGKNLTPFHPITVHVTFKAPTPDESIYYWDRIEVCALDNPDDIERVIVNAGVVLYREINKSLLFIFEHFIYMFPILRKLLRL